MGLHHQLGCSFLKWSRTAGGSECSGHSCGYETPVTFHGSVGAGTLWQACTGEVWLVQQQKGMRTHQFSRSHGSGATVVQHACSRMGPPSVSKDHVRVMLHQEAQQSCLSVSKGFAVLETPQLTCSGWATSLNLMVKVGRQSSPSAFWELGGLFWEQAAQLLLETSEGWTEFPGCFLGPSEGSVTQNMLLSCLLVSWVRLPSCFLGLWCPAASKVLRMGGQGLQPDF